MPQIFISYTHVKPDEDLAAELSAFLENNGFDVFLDSKIRLGQNWVEQIDVQLRNSTHFVPLLSAASIKSDMVRREIAIAYKLKKADKITILPVRLSVSEELPYELGAYLDLIQYIVWRPGESFNRICRAILDAARGGSAISGATGSRSAAFAAPELERLTLRTQVLTRGAILGRAGRRLVLHLSQSWGGLKTRSALLDNILRWQIPTSPKFNPILAT
ncbi:MAG: toll/interleukin-1 receptor domain-containing protein [Acidobacteriaceae bacterium]|nr:toll/interleukin-1 receptor domain-containing protein [Acidobacteriaceae bacterium]